ncbi:MAG: hypothetical protein H0V00_10895 [Chloroflexia bacterium]|nr:hypothetical protein [Chloroflexia bacterium]
MSPPREGTPPERARAGRVVRPDVWRTPDRHILLGVSHVSDDPALHRVFEVRASYDATTGGWLASVAEQNQNEQREDWGPRLSGDSAPSAFPTAAACLGDTVSAIVAMVDRDALGAAHPLSSPEPRPAAPDDTRHRQAGGSTAH